MELTARQIKILEAIINDYIMTAEPIGSRTIEKKYNLGVSSATIRNEMSDLEDMGLILQPHTSSGRIPSDLGYRVYVNSILEFRDLTSQEEQVMKEKLLENLTRIDSLMYESAKILATLTRYPAVVSEPKFHAVSLKHIQLVPVDTNSIAMVLVTNGNIVKNFYLEMPNAPRYEDLLLITNMINKHLAGVEVSDIPSDIVEIFAKELPPFGHMYEVLMEAILGLLYQEEDLKIYTAGVNQLLAFPEFASADKAREVFAALEEPDTLLMLFKQQKHSPVGVVIGAENDLAMLKDCSIIRADYGVGEQALGSIGIIGPTRMDYGEVISVLKGLVELIDKVLHQLKGG